MIYVSQHSTLFLDNVSELSLNGLPPNLHTSLVCGQFFPPLKNLAEEYLKFCRRLSIGSAYFVVVWASQPELNK